MRLIRKEKLKNGVLALHCEKEVLYAMRSSNTSDWVVLRMGKNQGVIGSGETLEVAIFDADIYAPGQPCICI